MTRMPSARRGFLLLLCLSVGQAVPSHAASSAFPATGTGAVTPVSTPSPWTTGNPGTNGTMCLTQNLGDPGGATCGAAPAAQPSGQPSSAVGNPIDVMSGNKFQPETDLPALPGPLGLQFSRSYNSRSQSRGVLGVGWRHAYELTLFESASSVQILQADGRRLIFPRQASGACASVRPEDGRIEQSAKGWRWLWPSGRELAFEPVSPGSHYGRLTMIRDLRAPGQPFLALRYGLQGELLGIRDPQGRTLSFAYGVYGPHDWPEVRITGPAGLLRYRLDGSGNLLTVQRPDGVQVGYYYEPFRQGGDAHNLTGRALWQPDSRRWQRQATWAYDEQDRAVLSEHAGGIERIRLQFADKPVAMGPGHLPVFETRLTDSLGRETRYRWQVAGQEWRLLEVRGSGCAACGATNRRYSYNDAGQLWREERLSRAGDVLDWTEWSRDRLGRIVRRQRGGAGVTPVSERYAYERPDFPWTVTAVFRPSVLPGKEAATRYRFDAQGRLLATEESGFSPLGEALSRSRHFSYDPAGRLQREDGPLPNLPDGRGDITHYHYDAVGRLDRLDGPGGLSLMVRSRNTLGRLTGLDVRNGSRRESWRTTYDRQGHLSELVRQAEGLPARRQRFAYDEQGRLTARTDAAGLTVRLRYDDAGRLQQLIGPDGQITDLARDTENRLLSLQRRDMAATTPFQTLSWQYLDDTSGQIVRRADGLGLLDEQRRSDDGRQQLDRDALGRERRTLFDGWGRWQVSQLQALGLMLPVEWTQRERGAEIRSGAGLQAVSGYDDWGRLVLQRLPGQGVRLYRHDAADNRIAEVGEDGQVMRYRYDYAGHRIAEGNSRNPQALVTQYDGDLPVARLSAAESRHWRYNAFGERVAEQRRQTEPDGQHREWHLGWSYDDGGRVRVETRGDLHLTYRYGADGRVAALYAAEGRLAGLLSEWFHGPIPLLSQPLVDRIRYDHWGLISNWRLMNGTEQHRLRDGRGRLTGIRTHFTEHRLPGLYSAMASVMPDELAGWLESRFGLSTPRTRQSHYGYDAIDRLQQQEEDQLSQRYGYDAAGHLSRVETRQGGKWVETAAYTYDPQGNRRFESTPVQQVVYRYADDGVRWLGRQSRQPDHAGMPSFLTQLASYDPIGRPSVWWQGVTNPAQGLSLAGLQTREAPLWRLHMAGGQPVAWTDEQGHTPLRYGYDITGMPLRLSLQSGPRSYWRRLSDYSGALRMREEEAWRGEHGDEHKARRDYVYLDGLPVAVRVTGESGSEWGEVTASRLGAPVSVRDRLGLERWSAVYDPFGGKLKTEALNEADRRWAVSLRLPGQYEDPVTGFYQNGFRTYLPEAGRYLTPDPAGLRGGLNPFVYVGSDPLNAVDPWGLYQIDMHYYMTYFLGIVTGFSADQARTIALATQFVDENDYTVPLRDGVGKLGNLKDGLNNAIDNRLPFYHFVNNRQVEESGLGDEMDPANYDLLKEPDMSVEDYRFWRLDSNLGNIPQLQKMASNVGIAPCESLKLQFVGEFFHAFEDTFAHRDQDNVPFHLNSGTGHLFGGAHPDYTYNHEVPGLFSLGNGVWSVNEEKSIIAQEAIYHKMKDFRDQMGVSGKEVSWDEIEPYLIVFNAIHENANGSSSAEDLKTLKTKIGYLEALLNGGGTYQVSLGGLEKEFSGVEMADSPNLGLLDTSGFTFQKSADKKIVSVSVNLPGWGYKSKGGSAFDLIGSDNRAGADGFDTIEGLNNRVDSLYLEKANVAAYSGVIWSTGYDKKSGYKIVEEGGLSGGLTGIKREGSK